MTNSKTIITTAVFKQILNYALLPASVVFISCNEQNKPGNLNGGATEQAAVPKETENDTLFEANRTTEIGKNINSIFQDRNNNYWFSSNGEGVYRYDGKNLVRFTDKDGLYSNYAGAIQEDRSGNIWFCTGNKVSRFDGRTFTTFPGKENLQPGSSSGKKWKTEPGDLWFQAGSGAYRCNGNSFTYLPLPSTNLDSNYSQTPYDPVNPFTVYCTCKDRAGNLWFGTQTLGVCRYDGKSFTWFTGKGLNGPAVRGIFEDRNGNLWFGNNGAGLFRYDGNTLTNFTAEKGLGNDEFWSTSKISGKSKPGTLARVWTINEDNNGDLWIGTTDAGAWRYDGEKLTNYTTKDGLTSNAINTIYKDKKGELWFGTDGGGVCKFNGTSFTSVAF